MYFVNNSRNCVLNENDKNGVSIMKIFPKDYFFFEETKEPSKESSFN